MSQIYSSLYAKDKEARVSYYLTEGGAKVDIILELDDEVHCIEVKSATSISKISTKGFDSFKNFYKKQCNCYIFYAGEISKNINGIEVLPWQEGIKQIGL